MAKPLEMLAVDDSSSPPGAAIGSEPESSESPSNGRDMLGRQRGDVRMMVLHRYHRRPVDGELRCRKIGMQVAGNRHRFDLEDRQHVPESFLEEIDRVRRVEVADMLRVQTLRSHA